MKYPTEKSKKYPGLEQLSTAELEDLLRRDFAASEDDDASMALITEIMEVIQAREAQQELPVDEDTAWEMFLMQLHPTKKFQIWIKHKRPATKKRINSIEKSGDGQHLWLR